MQDKIKHAEKLVQEDAEKVVEEVDSERERSDDRTAFGVASVQNHVSHSCLTVDAERIRVPPWLRSRTRIMAVDREAR